MEVVETRRFSKTVKKLNPSQKKQLDDAVKHLLNNPKAGELKKGDLRDVRVYKFKIQRQEWLLVYTFDDSVLRLTLLMLGSHENFYRDLKRQGE